MIKPVISIIIPMYNSKDIKVNMQEAMKSLNKIGYSYEIILVDDGSKNDCYAEAKKIKSKNLTVVRYFPNKGKGNAIKYGFKFTKGEYVAFVDSGRDIDPFQLKSFLEIISKENADIVIGSKRHPQSKLHYPLIRRVMSRTYQLINKILFNLNLKDTQVGIKLFKRKILSEIMPKIAVKRFAFDLELLVLANKIHAKIVEAPVIIRYQFKSTVNVKAVFWMLWDTAAIFYRDKILNFYQSK